VCREAAWAEPAAKVTCAVSGSKQDVRIIIKFRKGVIAAAVIPFYKIRKRPV
jgi:hypothetical protein